MIRRAMQIAAMVAVVAVIGWAATRIDWRALVVSLRAVDYRVWLVAVAVGAGWKLAAKAARSHVLVCAISGARGVAAPNWRTTARLFAGTHALGQLLWPPVGMSLRTAGLVRDGLPVIAAAQVQVGERIAEAVALIALAALAVAVAPGALTGVFGSGTAAIAVAIAVAGVAVIAIAAAVVSRRVRRAWSAGARPLLASSAWALVSHLGDVVILLAAAHAASTPVALPAAIVAVLAVNSAAVIPLVPGQLGVLEAAVVVGLAQFGIAAEPALVVAIAYRTAYLVPLVGLGMPMLLVETSRTSQRLRQAPESPG